MNKISFIILILSINFLFAQNLNKYCINYPVRQTNIIIDNYKLNKQFFNSIFDKLNFMPHEKINIYFYNNKTNNLILLQKIYKCIPKLSKKEIYNINHNTPLYKRALSNKVEDIKDQFNMLKNKIKNNIKNFPISQTKNDNFITSILNISDNLDQQSRIIIFSKRTFKSKNSSDFKYANVYIYSPKVPSKSILKNNKNFFMKNKSDLISISSFVISQPQIDTFKKFNLKINLQLNKPLKGNILLTINHNGKIINGWLEVYGVLLAPLKGKVIIKNNKIVSLKATVKNHFYYYNNHVLKNDKLELKLKNKNYIGKYYNYNYVLENNPNNYFEYKIN